MPARPGCTTPRIRFLFVAPHLWIGLPPDPTSRGRPCPSPSLRLREHLARGLAPREFCAMSGTHVPAQQLARECQSAAAGCSAGPLHVILESAIITGIPRNELPGRAALRTQRLNDVIHVCRTCGRPTLDPAAEDLRWCGGCLQNAYSHVDRATTSQRVEVGVLGTGFDSCG